MKLNNELKLLIECLKNTGPGILKMEIIEY